MKTVELNIDHTTRPQGLAGELRKHNLQHGDKLTVITPLDKEMTMLIILVSLVFLYQQKIDYANKVLEDIFASQKGSTEIQNEIEKEYGIHVEVETKERQEDDNWQQFSREKLSKAYSIDEPEYDLSMVKEPNPTYKK